MITSAPSARSSRAFSCDILSGMVKTQRYPFTAAASASPTPVLPDVASTIRPPGLRRPSRSAASIIATPMRSFTDPPGLKNSALAYTGVRIPCVTRFSRTSGVQPRSEEHTSELQSRLHLVCRLLLEKKKKRVEKFQQVSHNDPDYDL